MINEVVVKTPGRICLLGDKNDMRNGPVIAAAISKFFIFKTKLSKDNILRFTWVPENRHFERDFNSESTDSFFKFLSAICLRLKDKIKPIECEIDGDLPIGSGLSSSAACCIGFIQSLNKLFSLGMHNGDIAELAYIVERNDLGIMCGRMDQYSIAFGGITYIETGDQTKVTRLSIPSLSLVIGDSCEPRMAKEVLNHTMEMLDKKDPHFISCFDTINQNVQNGIKAIANNDQIELGRCMCVHQEMERSMNASTAKLDAMCKASIEAGAFGAKQIGAGGGGCMIALCSEDIIDQVMTRMTTEVSGVRVWKANVYQSSIEEQ